MKLLMISGDRSVPRGKKGAFWNTLRGFSKEWERIDVICPAAPELRVASCELRESRDPTSQARHPQPDIRHFSDDGIQVSPDFPNVFFHPCPRGLWYQPRWILRCGSDLVRRHAHGVMTVHEYPPFYNGLGAFLLHRRMGVPYCLEIHHVVGDPVPSSLGERVGRLLTRLLIRADASHARAVRTVNEGVRSRLVSWGVPGDKVRVVPSFYLDPATFVARPGAGKTFDVAFCARLVANKGLPETLEALRLLPGRTLLVLGDGPLLEAARRAADAPELSGRVTFRGWVADQSALMEELRSARVFVMNSRSEGGPRVALEAMACGLPVVATRVGVMSDVIVDGANGLLTDGTPGDLAAKLSLLLERPELAARIGDEARRVLDRFDGSALLAGYASFLRGLAA